MTKQSSIQQIAAVINLRIAIQPAQQGRSITPVHLYREFIHQPEHHAVDQREKPGNYIKFEGFDCGINEEAGRKTKS